MNIFNKSKFTDISRSLLESRYCEPSYCISSVYGYSEKIKIIHLNEILAEFKDQIDPSDGSQLLFTEFSLDSFI